MFLIRFLRTYRVSLVVVPSLFLLFGLSLAWMNIRFYRDYYVRSKEPFRRVRCTTVSCDYLQIPCFGCIECEQPCYETQLTMKIPINDNLYTLYPTTNCTSYPVNSTFACALDEENFVSPLSFAPPIDRKRHRNLVLYNIAMAVYIAIWCFLSFCSLFLDCYKCIDESDSDDE